MLGRKFGYYSAGLTETFRQTVPARFAARTRYCLTASVQGGGDNTGRVPFQIGHGSGAAFVAKVNTAFNVDIVWRDFQTCYNTGTSGAELGQTITIGFGTGANGGQSDVWFDNLKLTGTPLP